MTPTTENPRRKQRIITLTDRKPVSIFEDEWPVIAEASSGDGAVPARDLRRWSIKVRQHADGRRIVYGALVAGPGQPIPGEFREWRGGWLFAATGTDDDTVEAINTCGEHMDARRLAAECIARLPPEVL